MARFSSIAEVFVVLLSIALLAKKHNSWWYNIMGENWGPWDKYSVDTDSF